MTRLQSVIKAVTIQLANQSSQHRVRNAILCILLLCSSCALTFLAANIGNYVDPTPAPLADLFAATFSSNCYPTFLHHPDPYLVLGIPSPPIFEHGGILDTADIGEYIYDEESIIQRAYKQAHKCWHVDKLGRHKGLSKSDMNKISGEHGILRDARNRALDLAIDGRGTYPAWIMGGYPRESTLWVMSGFNIGISEFTFLREAAKGDAALEQQFEGQKRTFGFKQLKDCPPCTPDHLLRTFIEAAFTPAWNLSAQPWHWRHIPSTCARCDWSKIQESYTFFFGPWSFDWRTMTLRFTDLAKASEEGRLPPPGLAHQFWWGRDMDAPYIDKNGRGPTQRRIALQLLHKYVLFTLRTARHAIFGTVEEQAVFNYPSEIRMGIKVPDYCDWEENDRPVWKKTKGSITYYPNKVVVHDGPDQKDPLRFPDGAGREWPQIIHLFLEQLAMYGRNTTKWKKLNHRNRYGLSIQRDGAREAWEEEKKARKKRLS